ncbi:hypothetical protein OG455_08835 [Kitasatospora sp. NBC_01287]|uniref:hypothetical protein n=1 Tax=Kitasatospora sp. NBC_01287 TaxID=2903573 RepID=UPI00224F0CCD|nr:hypothetical protein [Kitasatospora sp. NBC_01287]MCX4745624.1 hypothetical protein [Kitasatospora sp. NBC_01287]
MTTTTASGIPADAFADPFTRRLLHHRGSTTAQLEQWLGCRLRLRVVDQRLTPLSPPGDPLAAAEACLVRRTELLTGNGLVVSRNLVIGQLPQQQELVEVVTALTVPLGRAVAERGIAQRRTALGVSLGAWREPLGNEVPAVRRRYLLRLATAAPLYVVELFNPAVVPPRQGALWAVAA